jgi:hypothetical protein
MVKPAENLPEVVDARAGNSDVRQGVVPGTDEHLAGSLKVLEKTEWRVGVAVPPASDQKCGTVDALRRIAHRSVPPILTVRLVTVPLEQVRFVMSEVVLPDLCPSPARPLRVRR